MKRVLKALTRYPGSPQTARVRQIIGRHRRHDWPYVPDDEGDVLYQMAAREPEGDALQIGLATGSTALYILEALPRGRLTSIDFAQRDHDYSGVKIVDEAGLTSRHRLIEENSVAALPRLWADGQRFHLVFLDGWKTFDHLWVDTFYCAKMLKVGGHVVFDDARMPAVRKCISLLVRYYAFAPMNVYPLVGGLRQRAWHLMSTRSILAPYRVLRKTCEIEDTAPGRSFDWWRTF